MSDTDTELWLDSEDEACRNGRLARLDWIATLAPKAAIWLFPGGWVAKGLFEEARYCFVYGQYIAAVALGMAYIEYTIAANLYAAGGKDKLERANITGLLREAASAGWITEEEYSDLNTGRILRNPLIHFRRPLFEDTIEYRAVSLNEQPDKILEADAQHVMRAMFRVCARQAV